MKFLVFSQIKLVSSILSSAHPNSRTLRIHYGTSGKIEARATIKIWLRQKIGRSLCLRQRYSRQVNRRVKIILKAGSLLKAQHFLPLPHGQGSFLPTFIHRLWITYYLTFRKSFYILKI